MAQTALQEAAASTEGLPDVVVQLVADAMWGWFEANQDRKLFAIHILFINIKSVTVADLYDVFVLLFGAKPLVPAQSSTQPTVNPVTA